MSYDWNHNGKQDAFDSLMDYEICNDSTGFGGGSNSSNAGCLTVLTMLIGFGIVAVIINALAVDVDDIPVAVLLIILIPVLSIVAAFLSRWSH